MGAVTPEELLEAEAIEEPALDGEVVPEDARPLPEKARAAEVEAFRDEVKTAALAAAGGIVAGVATVAMAKAARGAGGRRTVARAMRRNKRAPQNVIASRSFLIDVHVLGR